VTTTHYRWLSPAECVALHLGPQVSELVTDQNRIPGRTISADEWADRLWRLIESPICKRSMATAYREALASMRVSAEPVGRENPA